MCHVLYLASDKERPLVSWEEGRRAFHVTRCEGEQLPHLTKPHLRYLGSDQGCGCGFQHLAQALLEDDTQRAEVKRNQQGLASYLAGCLTDEESVELFGCWNGDESLPLEHRREIRVADLLDDDFHFEERELLTVRA